MQTVTRKSELNEYLNACINAYQADGLSDCVKAVHAQILSKKIKFPLLEFCGNVLSEIIPEKEQIELCDQIEAFKTEGGNVILGVVLQNRLQNHFEQSTQKATAYISQANAWYVCDIIGERVYGFSLLHQPAITIPEIKRLSRHESHWVVRALGAGIHYAIKKGLNKKEVRAVFPVLLSMANTKNKEIKQGVGWAAKTTAKFHPDIIEAFSQEIQNNQKVADWFRKKIDIGLNRNKNAGRN